MSSHDSPSERRAHARGTPGNSVTGLVQSILHDSTRTAENLLEDIRLGADPLVVLSLLGAAEGLTRIRGLDLGAAIQAIRMRILDRLAADDTPANGKGKPGGR